MSSDVEQIRSLAIRYAEAVDRRRFEAAAELFIDSGTLEPPGALRTGRGEIAAALEGLRRYTGTFHHLGQHRVDLDGDSSTGNNHATGEAYCQAHHFGESDGQRHDRVLFIRYQDSYVRTRDGWRFASRQLEVDWVEEREVGPAG